MFINKYRRRSVALLLTVFLPIFITSFSTLFMTLAVADERGDTHNPGLPSSSHWPQLPPAAAPIGTTEQFNDWLNANADQFGFSKGFKWQAQLQVSTGAYQVYRVQQQLRALPVFGHQSVFIVKDGQPKSADILVASRPSADFQTVGDVTPLLSTALAKQGLYPLQPLHIERQYWALDNDTLLPAYFVAASFATQRHSSNRDGVALQLVLDQQGNILKRWSLKHSFRYEIVDVDDFCQRLNLVGTAENEELRKLSATRRGDYPPAYSVNTATTSNAKKLASLFDETSSFMSLQLKQDGFDGRNGVTALSFVGNNFYSSRSASSLGCTGNNNSNAFWYRINGNSGEVQIHSPFLVNPEVIMHELGHGIVSFSSDLTYFQESGALNEAYADAMGVSFAMWRMKRMASPAPSDWGLHAGQSVIRSFANPTSIEHMRDHYSERYTGSEDDGGVHVNSSIINHAFYLLAEGGEHRRLGGGTVPKIGVTKAMQIWHYGVTNLLTKVSDFQRARYAFADAAEILFGEYGPERTAVHQAFDAVGVKGTWVENVPPVVPPEPPVPQPQEPNSQAEPPPVPPANTPVPAPVPTTSPSTNSALTLVLITVLLAIVVMLWRLMTRAAPGRAKAEVAQPYQFPPKATDPRPEADHDHERAKPRVNPDKAPRENVHREKVQPQKVLQWPIPQWYLHFADGVVPLDSALLAEQGILLGRAADNHLVVSGASVSKYHARLSWQHDQLCIEDLGSRYGTKLNNQALTAHQPVAVRDRDEVWLADVRGCCSLQSALVSKPVDSGEILILVDDSGAMLVRYASEQCRAVPLSIGRQADNMLVLNDAAVSRRHAEIRYHQGQWWLIDLNSANGTIVKNARGQQQHAAGDPVLLATGCILELGEQQLTVRIERTAGAAS